MFDSGKLYDVGLGELNFPMNLVEMTVNELANAHIQVVRTEQKIQTIDIIAKFYGGLIYHTVYSRSSREEFLAWMKQWKIDVSSSTVYRYIPFTSLITRFPRLTFSGLSFSQILKHKKRIIDHMGKEENYEIAHRLAKDVEVKIGGTTLTICCRESQIPTDKIVSFDADWEIHDRYEKAKDNIKIEPVPEPHSVMTMTTEDNIIDQLTDAIGNC